MNMQLSLVFLADATTMRKADFQERRHKSVIAKNSKRCCISWERTTHRLQAGTKDWRKEVDQALKKCFENMM